MPNVMIEVEPKKEVVDKYIQMKSGITVPKPKLQLLDSAMKKH
jgi:hypothetical protein